MSDTPTPPSAESSAEKPLIAAKHLNVTYFPGKSNEVKALKDINLEIHQGEFIIFFGPSGCGKSTLLYSLAGLETHITGDIIVNDKNLRTMTQHELEEYHQKTIGMIFQSFYLIASLSILQNVALPQVALKGAKREREKRAQELLDHFGVGKQAHKLPAELSGGQQQRVAISRALVNEPLILIADEPVGNLDSKSSHDVMQLLLDLNDKEKKTVILVTHDPSHLHFAHRVFYLRDGTLTSIKENTPEERAQTMAEAQTGTAAIEHWLRTFTADGQTKDKAMAKAKQAQEILAELLIGMPSERVMQLEDQVFRFLVKEEETDPEAILSYIEKEVLPGGIVAHRERARHLADELRSLLILLLGTEGADAKPPSDAKIAELRDYLIGTLNIGVNPIVHTAVIDQILRDRFAQTIKAEEVIRSLSRPFADGGAGLSEQNARQLSHRLEDLLTLLRQWRQPSQEIPATNQNSAPAPQV